MPVQLTKSLVFALTLSAFPGAGAALAAGSHAGGHGSGIGEPANAAAADRTIEIAMGDNLYEPERLTLGAGETVRFVLKIDGEFRHEINLGTADMHAAHQKEMTKKRGQRVIHTISADPTQMQLGEK